jgi:hypothetical protein
MIMVGVILVPLFLWGEGESRIKSGDWRSEVAQVVKHQSSRSEALSSNTSNHPHKKKQNQETQGIHEYQRENDQFTALSTHKHIANG